jgi:hypothetical protein
MTTKTTYLVRTEGAEQVITATDLEDAIEQAEEWAAEGWNDVDSTMWAHAWLIETIDGNETSHSITVQIDPPQPKCIDSGDHDWQGPHDLVGGIKENPGVWGHGGGVTIQAVCMRCGCGRLTDTWAQDPMTGEQGLTSVEYQPGRYQL